MNAGVVMVTGASGYLGGKVAAQLRAQAWSVITPERQVFDLTDPDPFVAVTQANRDEVTHIVHAAAVTRFDVSREHAERVNVEGAQKLLAFAHRCPRLRKIVIVSSIHASGLLHGAVGERYLDDEPEFANWYEWSKWQTERVASNEEAIPVLVLRVPTVVCDGPAGGIVQHNAFHYTLRLWFNRLLSVLPGAPTTPLHVIDADSVVRGIVDLLAESFDAGVYNLAAADEAPMLGDVLDLTHGVFSRSESYRRARVMRPLLIEEAAFERLREGFHGTGSSVVSQALDALSPFALQLFVRKQIVVGKLPVRNAVNGAVLIESVCREIALANGVSR